jgi:hypothetical protein
MHVYAQLYLPAKTTCSSPTFIDRYKAMFKYLLVLAVGARVSTWFK